MKRIFVSIFALMTISACVNQEVKNENTEEPKSIVATEESVRELRQSLSDVEKEEQRQLAEEMANMTTMSFDRMSHDYGKVLELSDNKTTFTVTNTGKKPLIIEKVSASCGCTTPSKPEKPIAPGKSDQITVVFHPKENQLGQQNKTVTVIANTEPKMEVLNISAMVEKKKN
jgi:TolA-binding protein